MNKEIKVSMLHDEVIISNSYTTAKPRPATAIDDSSAIGIYESNVDSVKAAMEVIDTMLERTIAVREQLLRREYKMFQQITRLNEASLMKRKQLDERELDNVRLLNNRTRC